MTAAQPVQQTGQRWPDDFLFGVAACGFQVEGGFNGPGEPANNWQRWEAAGRVEPSGAALDLWNRYEDALDRVAALGCNSFRTSVEWARCEPVDGELDGDALDRYAALLDGCADRGLTPVVTMHHFTHPAWLGEDFWLRSDSPDRFETWAEVLVTQLGRHCDRWVTLNEINILPVQSYLTGGYPPGRRGDVRSALRALDHMLAAHVLAHAVVHRHQGRGRASTNNGCSSVYEMDRLLVDVLLARHHGISRDDLDRWLSDRRRQFHETVGSAGRREAALRRLMARVIPLSRALPRAVATVYEGSHECPLDSVQLDYYDPVISHHLRVPGHRSAGERTWEPGRKLWDDVVSPGGLVRYLRANHQPGLTLEVVENGLCNRVRRGRSYPRSDGWSRPGYLEANLTAVADALAAGLAVGGYWHWTLADNYEWGSYEPRFGIYGVDRERGLRWSDRDSMGDDSAGTYRRLIDELRSSGLPTTKW